MDSFKNKNPGNYQTKSLAAILCVVLLLCSAGIAQNESDNNVTQPTGAIPQNHLAIGNDFYNKEMWNKAAHHYLQAVEENQNVAFAWFNLGNCRAQQKQYHKAIVAYQRSVEVAPNFTRGWSLLGDVYYTVEAYGYAMAAYKRVIEIEGPNLHAYQMMGECALRGGDITEALQYFDQALKIEPHREDIYLAMAEAYARIRDFENAQGIMEKAINTSLSPRAEAYFYLGRLYEMDEKYQKAVRYYEEGLLLAPRKKDYYERIAYLHEKSDADFLALLILEQALEAGIKTADIYLQRGLIFFRQQRYEKALDAFRHAYQKGSHRGRVGMENVAAALFNEGREDQAEEIYAEIRE